MLEIYWIPYLRERSQITHYKENQYYGEHFDASDMHTQINCLDVGMRLSTMIIYLNDDYKGGHTIFPRLGMAVIPKKGKAVYFKNLTHGDLLIHPLSLHVGDLVYNGEKWVMNQWIRIKPIP